MLIFAFVATLMIRFLMLPFILAFAFAVDVEGRDHISAQQVAFAERSGVFCNNCTYNCVYSASRSGDSDGSFMTCFGENHTVVEFILPPHPDQVLQLHLEISSHLLIRFILALVDKFLGSSFCSSRFGALNRRENSLRPILIQHLALVSGLHTGLGSLDPLFVLQICRSPLRLN